MFHKHTIQNDNAVTATEANSSKEKTMARKSTAIVLVSLSVILLFSGCAGARIVWGISTVYAAGAETTLRPQLADRQSLAEYQALLSSHPMVTDRPLTAVQNHFLIDRQAVAEYQATLPTLVLAGYTAPTSRVAPLMLDDHQDLADYQATLGN